MKEIYEVLITGFLEKKSIEFFQDMNEFRFLFDSCHAFSYVKTSMIALDEGIQTNFYHPLRISEEKMEAVSELLKQINSIIPHGHFSLIHKGEVQQGEIVYSVAIRINTDRPIIEKLFAMRLSLVQESVIFSICSECILNAMCSQDICSDIHIEKLKKDRPVWNSKLNEIPIQNAPFQSNTSTHESENGARADDSHQ